MRRGFLLLTLAWVVGLAGCGGASTTPKAKLFPVKGRVTLNGAPLTGCTLILMPIKADPGADDGYSGVLNEKGEFELATMKGKAGAAAGKYKVTFSTSVAAVDPNSEEGRKAAMQSMMSGGGGPPAAPKEPPFPKEFSQFSTSTKEVEISREANELLIAL